MREIEILKKQNNFSKEGKDNEKDKRKTPWSQSKCQMNNV